MEVIKKRKMKDGTDILIENWHNDYSELYAINSVVACFPIAKESIHDVWEYPKRGEVFRYQLDFKSENEALEAFNELLSGSKIYSDFISHYTGNLSKADTLRCI